MAGLLAVLICIQPAILMDGILALREEETLIQIPDMRMETARLL